eukprot:scaffold241_cov242-Pinguiococcus_pyrenoidosus.AAC.20
MSLAAKLDSQYFRQQRSTSGDASLTTPSTLPEPGLAFSPLSSRSRRRNTYRISSATVDAVCWLGPIALIMLSMKVGNFSHTSVTELMFTKMVFSMLYFPFCSPDCWRISVSTGRNSSASEASGDKARWSCRERLKTCGMILAKTRCGNSDILRTSDMTQPWRSLILPTGSRSSAISPPPPLRGAQRSSVSRAPRRPRKRAPAASSAMKGNPPCCPSKLPASARNAWRESASFPDEALLNPDWNLEASRSLSRNPT